MIKTDNFKEVLLKLGFQQGTNDVLSKHFDNTECDLKADLKNKKLIFPTDKGFIVNDGTTSNFDHPENFVVFECVCRLLEKGYRPDHIELEPRWSLGHGGKSGKADICVKNIDDSEYLCIIECKTAGDEYKKELKNMKEDGGQLFSYWQQSRATKWLILYASDFVDKKLTYTINTVNCSDDANYVELAQSDNTLKLYKDATTVEDLFKVWKETYEQKLLDDIIFDDETKAYEIGVLPLKKKRLVDFDKDAKIVNQFEEILRHNNVSDKENAFNRLIALFIAKLYDEKMKNGDNEVDFQYKTGTDTYQTMQDRLQKLHHFGMKEFMKEDVFYVESDYVKNVMKTAIGENREQLEKEINETITKLKFYTNNDFAFKDVHNKELFYQNGKILVEMVELFQKYRIIDSENLQLLGDMFEQLLNKGFKQNEGQFFTPVPVTRFIWKSLPLENIVKNTEKNEVRYPQVIDYACGAGHFLTEGFTEINKAVETVGLEEQKGWERDCIFGIEKDYRLARVSKISFFMHGADNAAVVFGDGLDNHNEEILIKNGMFDILVANPPYSVSAFKNHLELKNNKELEKEDVFNCITKDGSEIETLFVVRTAQLLKPKGIAAVVLPSSILSNGGNSYIKARESLLKNFEIKSIVCFGSKTFGATGTNTVVLFLQKYDEPPVKANIVQDNVNAIFTNKNLTVKSDIEILDEYCSHIEVNKEDYVNFVNNSKANADYSQYENHKYFGMYFKAYETSTEYKTAEKQDASAKKKDGNEHTENRTKAFYYFVLCTEKEKVYYFALCYRQHTLIVTAPSDNSEQEKFLGYGWSNRKGDEGIKIKNEALCDTLCGYLYNDANPEESIARYVKDTFLGIYRSEGSMQKYVNTASLKDMFDFSRTTFDKAIKTSVTKKVEMKSNYELVKLGDVAEIYQPKTISGDEIKSSGKYKVFGANGVIGYHNEYNHEFSEVAMTCRGATCGTINYTEPKSWITGNAMVISPKNEKKLLKLYLKNYFEHTDVSSIITGTAQPQITRTNLSPFSIPLPPLEVQQQIVTECEQIDDDYKKAKDTIENCKQKIESIMENVQGETKKLGEICESYIGLTYKPTNINTNGTIVLRSSNIQDATLSFDDIVRVDSKISDKLYVKEGDVLVCVRNGSRRLLGKSAYINKVSEPMTFGAFMAICRSTMGKWIYLWMQTKNYYMQIEELGKTMSINQLTQTNLLNFTIPVPSLETQKQIVSQITAIESEIQKAKDVLAQSAGRKAEVLKKYLE